MKYENRKIKIKMLMLSDAKESNENFNSHLKNCFHAKYVETRNTIYTLKKFNLYHQ
jgi:uncharacterized protein with von Willebrand factor type A (vWA) domain